MNPSDSMDPETGLPVDLSCFEVDLSSFLKESIEAMKEGQAQLNKRIYDMPVSAIRLNGKKIRYFDFISSLQYDGCNEALKRIHPRIDMVGISEIIDQTPFISDLQKRFYKTILAERKARILDFSLKRLRSRENAAPGGQNDDSEAM